MERRIETFSPRRHVRVTRPRRAPSGPHSMSDLNPEWHQSGPSAEQSEVMGSRPGLATNSAAAIPAPLLNLHPLIRTHDKATARSHASTVYGCPNSFSKFQDSINFARQANRAPAVDASPCRASATAANLLRGTILRAATSGSANGLFWLVSSDALTTGVLSIHCLGELPSGRAEVPNFLAAASEPSAGIAPKSTDAFFCPALPALARSRAFADAMVLAMIRGKEP